MVWGHVGSNGHYHYMEAILVLDWMAPASPWQRRQGRWGTCQGCVKHWTLRERLPRRRGWDLNRTWCHPNKVHIWDNSNLCVDMFIMMKCLCICLSVAEKRRKMIPSSNCPNVSHEKWLLSQEGQLGPHVSHKNWVVYLKTVKVWFEYISISAERQKCVAGRWKNLQILKLH